MGQWRDHVIRQGDGSGGWITHPVKRQELKDPKAGFEWVERGPDYDTTYSLFDIPAHLVALHTLKGDFEEADRLSREL